MIHLGIIGTNWISEQFVQAAVTTEQYQLGAVYSRTLAKARTFSEKFATEVFCTTDLTTFVEAKEIDTIYIASPNALHFEQAKQAILANKNVIVEKPAFSTPEEMAEIIELANQQHVYFFEAARHLHEPAFQAVKQQLPLSNELKSATFTYMKYSSRYDEVLAGGEPPIFSLAYSGGALMDLGVYLVYAAVAWFGVPTTCQYFPEKITTGVDGLGTAILQYNGFHVTLQMGKICDSFQTAEICTTDQTWRLNSVQEITNVTMYDRATATSDEVIYPVAANPMLAEARAFATILQHPAEPQYGALYEEWVELARNVNKVVTKLRKSGGIIFPADLRE